MATDVWNLLVIEDDPIVSRQIVEFLRDEEYASRRIRLEEISDLAQGLTLIHERKADLVILDIYKGKAVAGGERTGVQVLDSIRRSGFVPVILYTALPEGLEDQRDVFTRLVGKEAGSLRRLKDEIDDLFRIRIPQLSRAIINHLDQTLASYMWGFVRSNWDTFGSIVDRPEFVRLVVQRLAHTFAREGIEAISTEIYGTSLSTLDPDKVHPAEYYVKPSLVSHLLLGDIRVRDTREGKEFLVVLWPSCDMVTSHGRSAKTDRVLCARAFPLADEREVTEWRESSSTVKEDAVRNVMQNRRTKSPDRFHYLPGVWDIPHLLVDFQRLEYLDISTVAAMPCLASLASPFAEALGNRFTRYLGRPGTPDLDTNVTLADLRKLMGGPS